MTLTCTPWRRAKVVRVEAGVLRVLMYKRDNLGRERLVSREEFRSELDADRRAQRWAKKGQ